MGLVTELFVCHAGFGKRTGSCRIDILTKYREGFPQSIRLKRQYNLNSRTVGDRFYQRQIAPKFVFLQYIHRTMYLFERFSIYFHMI